MKKLPLILTIVFFVFAVGGYFLYTNFFLRKSIDIWNLIPESSAFVYESGACEECIEPLKQSSVWKIIQKAVIFSKPSDSLKNIFDFLSGFQPNLVSLHVTKEDDFDFVFYSRVDKKNSTSAVEEWRKNKKIKFSEREFNSIKIQEASYGDQTFSWLFIDDVWVGSFTPFLLEDVVRTYQSDNETNFKIRISDIYQLPRMKNDAGNLYIHLKNFSDWLRIFLSAQPTALIQEFGKSCILDVKMNGKNFVLNGFSSDSINQSKYALSIFSDQNPVPFNLKKYISNRTVMLTSYGISDGVNLKKKLMTYAGKRQVLNDTLKQLSKSIDINIEQLFENINGEIGICFIESKGHDISKVMIVETQQSKMWMDALNKISSKLSIDTVFYEKFSDYEIRDLALFRFPEKLFWPLASGFDQTYYTNIGNTIVFAEDLEELKKFLEDVDKEETWGKSVNQNKYLESTLLEANISLYINTPRIWNILIGAVNSKWKNFITENETLLQSLGMGAIQFSHLSESFYTNISWSYKNESNETQHSNVNQRIVTNFGSSIRKMFVFKSHVDKRDETLIQDSSNDVHLISTEGKVLWTISLEGMILGDVEQIDYYNNGKLQFLFATQDKLHIVDRLGNYVKPFPVTVASSDIEYVSVVDYDHSRKYRFLLASKSGRLWMYDKDGNNLEGWQPKIIEDGLITAPKHHRIRGRDYILAIQKNGKVYLINRRGETLKNFPLNLDARPAGGYFLETGNDVSSTYFVVVSRDGYRIKFNLEGKIKSKEALLKTSPTTQFNLVSEENGKSYLIARQESKQLTLMDDAGRDILTNDFVGLDPVEIKYVDFGAGKILITITDVRQDLSFVYNGRGTLLTTPPIESNFLIPRNLHSGKLMMFSGYKNTIVVQSLP